MCPCTFQIKSTFNRVLASSPAPSVSPGDRAHLGERCLSMSKASALTSQLMSRSFCNLSVQHTQFYQHMHCLTLHCFLGERAGIRPWRGCKVWARAPRLTNIHPSPDQRSVASETALPTSSPGSVGNRGSQWSLILFRSQTPLRIR